jgi:hypothetical protein
MARAGVLATYLNAVTLRVIAKCLLMGGTLGILSSAMVNAALVEVSCSPFFAISFGLLFLTSAGTVGWQLRQDVHLTKNACLLGCFALLNLISGLECFALERDWSHGLSAQRKVPLYAMLGMCLAFSVNFSVLDLLVRCDLAMTTTLVVRTEWQVRVIAITSIMTGAMYGITFGVLDIEDQLARSPMLFREALHREARVCYPVGAASGALSAVLARILELRAESYDLDLSYARGHSGIGYRDSL